MKAVLFGAAGWLGRAILSKASGRVNIRAFDKDFTAWEQLIDIDGEWREGEIIHGDIRDFRSVEKAIVGMDAVIHTAVLYPRENLEEDSNSFLVNLKGLWNVLEVARRYGIDKVVHIGSCMTIHPRGLFFDSETRSIEGDLYGISKRLQEEMCRQFFDAHGMSIVVLRADYIVDSKLGIGKYREKLGKEGAAWRQGWVCRYDLAEATLLAVEKKEIGHEVLHIVGTVGAEKYCNVERAKKLLGLEFKGDLERFRL